MDIGSVKPVFDPKYCDVFGRPVQQGAIVASGHSYSASLEIYVVLGFTNNGMRVIRLTSTTPWYRPWDEEPTCRAVDRYEDPHRIDKMYNYSHYCMSPWDSPLKRHTMKNRILVIPVDMLTPKLKRQYRVILNYFSVDEPKFASKWN